MFLMSYIDIPYQHFVSITFTFEKAILVKNIKDIEYIRSINYTRQYSINNKLVLLFLCPFV